MEVLSGDEIEIHYWLVDKSHLIDAFILNKGEWELLYLMKEIALVCNVNIRIETKAIAEGGVIQKFKIYINSVKEGTISYGLLMTLLTGLIGTPLSIGATRLIEKLFEDTEMIELQKEKMKAEIESLKEDAKLTKTQRENIEIHTQKEKYKLYCQKLTDSLKVAKRASNYYEQISKEKRIEKISVSLVDSQTNEAKRTKTISKSEFANFILVSNELDPLIDEKAVIEIVSPVLKKGKYQWRGIYNGDILQFNMKSSEFKILVQTGRVEFKNGTCITCVLEMKRNLNNLGEEVIISYNVLKVIDYYDSVSPPQKTNEGIRYIQKKEEKKRQLNLFSDSEFEDK